MCLFYVLWFYEVLLSNIERYLEELKRLNGLFIFEFVIDLDILKNFLVFKRFFVFKGFLRVYGGL